MTSLHERDPAGRAAIRGLATLLALLLASASLAQSSAASLGLVGDVAAVREFHRFADDDFRLRSETRFGPGGLVVEQVSYAYDGRDGSLQTRIVTSYDATGRRVEQQVFGPDGALRGATTYRYDAAGFEVAAATVDAAGVETSRSETERDGAGRPLRALRYRDGVVERRIERRYDADGRLVEERSFAEEDRPTGVSTYSVPGRAYDFVTYDDEGAIDEQGTVELDADGRMLAVVSRDAAGVERYTIAFTYDAAGREVERRDVTDGETSVVRSVYTFDGLGNWILLQVFEDYGAGDELYEERERAIDLR
jgi:YD repeat-containing protein